MGFLSERSYGKPKLIENKVVKKIMDNENNKITFEIKAKDYLTEFIKLHYKIIIGIFLFGCLLYWRYVEIQNIRKKKETKKSKKTFYYDQDSDSDSE